MPDFFFKKRILIISPEAWGNSFVSKHHYAQTLATLGNEVYFIGPSKVDPQLTVPDRVHLLNSPFIPRGIGKLSPRLRRWVHKLIGRRIAKRAKGRFDVIWSFDTSRLYDLDALEEQAIKILHVVDLNQEFHWAEAARSSDICIGTSERIIARLKTENPQTLKLGHGLADTSDSDYQVNWEKGKHAVYAGNLSIPYIDWERMLNLVKAYPNVTFHFYGDDGSGNLHMVIFAKVSGKPKGVKPKRAAG